MRGKLFIRCLIEVCLLIQLGRGVGLAAVPVLVDGLNGTVIDTANNLTWLKKGNCFGQNIWSTASGLSNNLANGQCGLTDKSIIGNWRLPNLAEIQTLTKYSEPYASLNASGFADVQAYAYWSSDVSSSNSNNAWSVGMGLGNLASADPKTRAFFMLPVRSGQHWSYDTVAISKSGTGSGTVTASPGTIVWSTASGSTSGQRGTAIILTASSDGGSEFISWSGCNSVSGSICTVTVNAGKSVTATFGDIEAPIITAFGVSSSSQNLTVPITQFTAIDNVAVAGFLLTESALAPTVSAPGWLTTAPTSHTFATAGSKTLYSWVRDAAGNVASSSASNITVGDVIAPQMNAFTIPETSTSKTVQVSTLTATDNVAVTGYLVTESSTSPLATDTGWGASAPASYTVTAAIPEGLATTMTLFAWAKDAEGNVSLSEPANVLITVPRAMQKPGDCNEDLTITIAEVQSAINMFLGLSAVKGCVDVDNIGSVSISNVQKVINEFLGL